MKAAPLPARFERTVVGATLTAPKTWLVKLSCGHTATRHRQAEAPASARCAECARGSR